MKSTSLVLWATKAIPPAPYWKSLTQVRTHPLTTISTFLWIFAKSYSCALPTNWIVYQNFWIEWKLFDSRGTPQKVSVVKLLSRIKAPDITNIAQLPMDVSKGTYPACYRQFEQPNELQQHYYGSRDRRGCCWQRIVQKEPRVVADVLENHVKSQINQYLGLMMDQACRKLAENAGNGDSTSTKVFTWYDVLNFTEGALKSSHSVETSTADPCNEIHPMLETLQRKSDSDPLVLNPTVLRNVRKRLVDRYANVPR